MQWSSLFTNYMYDVKGTRAAYAEIHPQCDASTARTVSEVPPKDRPFRGHQTDTRGLPKRDQ